MPEKPKPRSKNPEDPRGKSKIRVITKAKSDRAEIKEEIDIVERIKDPLIRDFVDEEIMHYTTQRNYEDLEGRKGNLFGDLDRWATLTDRGTKLSNLPEKRRQHQSELSRLITADEIQVGGKKEEFEVSHLPKWVSNARREFKDLYLRDMDEIFGHKNTGFLQSGGLKKREEYLISAAEHVSYLLPYKFLDMYVTSSPKVSPDDKKAFIEIKAKLAKVKEHEYERIGIPANLDLSSIPTSWGPGSIQPHTLERKLHHQLDNPRYVTSKSLIRTGRSHLRRELEGLRGGERVERKFLFDAYKYQYFMFLREMAKKYKIGIPKELDTEDQIWERWSIESQ